MAEGFQPAVCSLVTQSRTAQYSNHCNSRLFINLYNPHFMLCMRDTLLSRLLALQPSIRVHVTTIYSTKESNDSRLFIISYKSHYHIPPLVPGVTCATMCSVMLQPSMEFWAEVSVEIFVGLNAQQIGADARTKISARLKVKKDCSTKRNNLPL